MVLKKNDLLKFKNKETGETCLSVVNQVNTNDSSLFRFYDDSIYSDDNKFEITAVWRYDENTDSFIKLYDKKFYENNKIH